MTKAYSRIKEQYAQISLPVRASIWFVICSVVQKGIAFIVTPVYTRILSTEEYGIFNVSGTWLTVFTILLTFNMSYGVFNNGMVKYKDERPQYISSMIGLTAMVTLLGICLFTVFHDRVISFLQLNFVIILAILIRILFTPSLNYWNAYQRYTYNYRPLIVVTLVIAITTPILSIVSVKVFGMAADGLVVSAMIIQVIIGGILGISQIKKGKIVYSKLYWKYALSLGVPLIPHYLSQVVLNSADKIMISRMCGNDKVAFYSVAYSIGQVIQIIVTSINSSLIPWTYQKMDSKEYNSIGRIVNYILLLLSGFILLFIAAGPEIVALMAPDEYYDGRYVIPPVAGSIYFLFLYNVFGNIEFFYEKTKKIALASGLSATLNIVLNWIFIAEFDYVAAGYTTLFCYVALAVFHYAAMKKVCSEKMEGKAVYNEKAIVAISVGFLLVLFLVIVLYNHIYIRYGFIFVCVTVMAARRREIKKVLNNIFTRSKYR